MISNVRDDRKVRAMGMLSDGEHNGPGYEWGCIDDYEQRMEENAVPLYERSWYRSLRRSNLLRQGIWETRKGSQIKIKDMDDNHLANTINFLGKNKMTYGSAYQEIMTKEQEKRKRRMRRRAFFKKILSVFWNLEKKER